MNGGLVITRTRWRPEPVIARVGLASERGLHEGAEEVLERAQRIVPLDMGPLRDSGTVSVEGDEAVVSYATHYAAILHAHPEWDYQNGRDGRWLERAFEEGGGGIFERVARVMQALLRW